MNVGRLNEPGISEEVQEGVGRSLVGDISGMLTLLTTETSVRANVKGA